MRLSLTFVFLQTMAVSGFVVRPGSVLPTRVQFTRRLAEADEKNSEPEEEEGLVLDNLDTAMDQMAQKYSFTESDFLAAAKKRAEMKVQSVESGATDEDWKKISDETKEKFGEVDDWDNAMKEAGNADSQILMFTDPPADGEDKGEDDPKLLLF